MFIGQFRYFTPARSTLQETFLYQERFINLFDGACIFTQSRSNSRQTYRTAFEFIDNRTKYLIVYLIQTILVMLSASSAKLAISVSIPPEPFTCAKSLTRRSKALAIRGVPRLRPAISEAALVEQGTSNMFAERRMMPPNTSSS